MKINAIFKSVEKVTTPFEAIKITYETEAGKSAYTLLGLKLLEVNSSLKTLVNKLAKEGDKAQKLELTAHKNEKGFLTVTDVQEVDKFEAKKVFTEKSFKKSSSFGSPSNIAGQIKGNVVTNAVTLAIAKNEMTADGLMAAALEVLELHKKLEAMDVAKIVGLESEKKSTKITVTKESSSNVDLDALLAESVKSKDLV